MAYEAWRFNEASVSLHDRLVGLLASLEPPTSVTRQLSTMMTMVTLQSVTRTLETDLMTTEFMVLPLFVSTGQPEYQIEIHLANIDGLILDEIDAALRSAQDLLAPGVD